MTPLALDDRTVYSRQQAADVLGVSLGTLKRMMARGDVQVTRSGRRVFILGSQLRAFLNNGEHPDFYSGLSEVLGVEVEVADVFMVNAQSYITLKLPDLPPSRADELTALLRRMADARTPLWVTLKARGE